MHEGGVVAFGNILKNLWSNCSNRSDVGFVTGWAKTKGKLAPIGWNEPNHDLSLGCRCGGGFEGRLVVAVLPN